MLRCRTTNLLSSIKFKLVFIFHAYCQKYMGTLFIRNTINAFFTWCLISSQYWIWDLNIRIYDIFVLKSYLPIFKLSNVLSRQTKSIWLHIKLVIGVQANARFDTFSIWINSKWDAKTKLIYYVLILNRQHLQSVFSPISLNNPIWNAIQSCINASKLDKDIRLEAIY